MPRTQSWKVTIHAPVEMWRARHTGNCHTGINGTMRSMKSQCLTAWQSQTGHFRGDDHGGDNRGEDFRDSKSSVSGDTEVCEPRTCLGNGKQEKNIGCRGRLVANLACASPALIL